jgi:hypothetical protein
MRTLEEAVKSLWDGPRTVGEYIELLSSFPKDWPVNVSTSAGGGIAVEHREISGKPVICIFGKNGGRFGENPLTETEYQKKSQEILAGLNYGERYTSIHGDHRLYSPSLGDQATCYGTPYDHRIIVRMVSEGLIFVTPEDLDRVAHFQGYPKLSPDGGKEA